MNFTKLLKYAVLTIWVILLVAMMGITVIEKVYGTEYAHEQFYSSSLFLLLWCLFTLVSCIYILRCKLYKRRTALMLHFSFLVILVGALSTWCFSERGKIHLSVGQSTDQFSDENDEIQKLPFVIYLKDFNIEYYKGTSTPMDFISCIQVHPDDNRDVEDGIISMNKIYSYDNYRFYQTGYYEDTTILSVSYDPYGIAITYTGYILLLLSIIMYTCSRKSKFRILLHKLSVKGFSLIALLMLFFGSGNASASEKELPEVLPEKVAESFGDLYIYYNERVCPVQTFAREFTRKIYGNDSYKGLSAEQVLTGWMFYYDSWKNEPVIEIKSSTVRDIMHLDGDYASVVDYFTSQNEYCLQETLDKIHKGEEVDDKRGFIEADEKFVIVSQVATGASMKIFPHVMPGDKGIEWYNHVGHLPSDLEHKEWVFVRKSLDYLNEKILMQNWDDAEHIIGKIKEYQEKKSLGMLPEPSVIKAEKLYNKIEYTRLLAIVIMIIGLLMLAIICRALIKNKSVSNSVKNTIDIIGVIAWVYLSVIMYLRWQISGHLPLSNGYETMQFMAWCTLLLTEIFRNKYLFIRPFGLVITGFALIVSMLGISNPQITPLMPVLSSPLLSVHVMVIMIAYALLSFIMLNGIMALVIYNARGKDEKVLQSFKDSSMLLMYPAVFLLGIGIFIGAVWANVSWGRYWGWDPKETWALITMLVYAMALHSESFACFRKPIFFHIFSIVAFISVLITYFGVNFMLGGMHSYA